MGKRLKLGITCYSTFGGSGVIATELGVALAERGHEVHFITSRLPARLQGRNLSDVSFHEVNTYTYALFQHSPYTLSLAAKMAEVAENFELDLLHVHYAIPHAISAHLAQEMLGGRIKVVTTLHGTDITLVGSDPSLFKITQFAINQSDAVTTVSDWLSSETVREFQPTVPLTVVRNFVDTTAFNPNAAVQFPSRHCPGDMPQLIHISNFRPVKRAAECIDILASVLKHRECRLLMVGDGPDLPRAMQRAKELGVTSSVQFMGNREDVASLLAASDIALIPSESESFGLAALEAMASGCAIVATNIGGLPELVRHCVDGCLHEVGDVEGMSSCIVKWLEDPELLTSLQQSARQRAVERFDLAAILPEYMAVYEQVLGEKFELDLRRNGVEEGELPSGVTRCG